MEIETEDKPGLEEQYSSAVDSSNLRVGNDSTLRTPGDLIAAAGMNRHRTGLALRRLHSEWASSSKPPPPTPESITALARSYSVEQSTLRAKVQMTAQQIEAMIVDAALDREKLKGMNWRAMIEVPNPHAGKVRTEANGKVSYGLPIVVAKQDREHWHQHELGLLLMSLKSLPWVRDAMLAKARREDWGCDEHVVAKVLLWWLDPKCQTCGGSKEGVIAGTGRTNGKLCRKCRGTGVQDAPHGWPGEKLAGYIRGCLAASKNELSEGMKDWRTPAGAKRREDQAEVQAVERREKVAAEERAEAERLKQCGKPPTPSLPE